MDPKVSFGSGGGKTLKCRTTCPKRIRMPFKYGRSERLLPADLPKHVCTGVGALYVRRRPRVRLEPLQNGGGQERGLRSGTVPTPLAVGLGAACSIAQQEMEVKKRNKEKNPPKVNSAVRRSDSWCLCLCPGQQYDHQRVSMLANRLVQKIMSAIPDVVMNGDPSQRYPGTYTHTHTTST